MVFLQQQQHCNYPSADVRPNCSYEAKMQDGLTPRLNPSFPREEAQVKSCGPEEPNSRSAESPDHQRPRTATATASPVHTARSTSGNCAPRQPLPGFQQAFGSTEIGKFSRSELFASLVEAASNVSSGRSSSNSSLDDQSATRTTPQQQQPQSSCAPTSSSSSFDSCSARSSSPELLGPGTPSPCYGYARLPAGAAAADFVGQSNGLATSSLPRWHSPYVGAVGSEF
ncbi:putative protein TPRXL [Copidosoma floridanum]|uniref:putative protein TPRXL n=1 Tax=Copidosoma floridanum TaxID=29053 RepID=UPI0006C9C853|nr:putative protein TPRXL [Copidosoma floridanum]